MPADYTANYLREALSEVCNAEIIDFDEASAAKAVYVCHAIGTAESPKDPVITRSS